MVDREARQAIVSTAADGFVLLDGAGVATTLNPRKALQIADQIAAAAVEAMDQERAGKIPRDLPPT